MARTKAGGGDAPGDEVAEAAQALHDSQKDAHKIASEGESDDDDYEGDLPEDITDHEAQLEASLARLSETIDNMTLDGGTLVGDLRDVVLDMFKTRHKFWHQMSPHEQRDVAQAIQGSCQKIVKEAVGVIAHGGRRSIRAVMGNVTIADKVEAKVKLAALPENEMAAVLGELYHLKGKTVLIISADDQGFQSQRREAVDPDDPELPLYADADGDADADADAGESDEDQDAEGAQDE